MVPPVASSNIPRALPRPAGAIEFHAAGDPVDTAAAY